MFQTRIMKVCYLVSLAWLLIISLSEVASQSQESSAHSRVQVRKQMQVCGQTLNHVLQLVCAGVYRKKRSTEYGQTKTSLTSPSFSLESGDVDTLQALYGEDLPEEDYVPLAYLLKENALYFDNGQPVLAGGPPSWSQVQDSPASPYNTMPRYQRLRRHQKEGIHYECCLQKCSYKALQLYCGDNRPGRQ